MKDTTAFERLGHICLDALRRYVDLARAGDSQVIPLHAIGEISETLDLDRWLRTGAMTEESFKSWLDAYLKETTKLHHPNNIGHQVAVPHLASALADLVNGVTNNGMAVYEMGPPGVALERAVIRWMLAKVDWGQGDGVLTHGGSLANLTAIHAAREKMCPQSWQEGVSGKLAILVPTSTHYSVSRASSILGMGQEAVYHLPCDKNGVLRGDAIEETFDRAVADGRRVIALVANACATATGLHDPLEVAGQFCQAKGIWFHVDAAHGCSAVLSPTLKEKLRGLELADSVVWDAHKMLQTSVLCAAVLFRDGRDLRRSFTQDASYLDSDEQAQNLDLYALTVECTKSALGLKLFLVLALLGEEELTRQIESLYAMPQQFIELASREPGFDFPYQPESNILCFRFGAGDEEQDRIRRELLKRGEYYITSALVDGRSHLRVTFMNTAMSEAVMGGLIKEIRSLAAGPGLEQAATKLPAVGPA